MVEDQWKRPEEASRLKATMDPFDSTAKEVEEKRERIRQAQQGGRSVRIVEQRIEGRWRQTKQRRPRPDRKELV